MKKFTGICPFKTAVEWLKEEGIKVPKLESFREYVCTKHKQYFAPFIFKRGSNVLVNYEELREAYKKKRGLNDL